MKQTYNLMWQKLCIVTVLLTTALLGQVYAQQRTITGTVKDETSLTPIIGASIISNDRSQSTSTDENGSFSLQVDASVKSLLISFIGYNPQTIAIPESNSINVLLSKTDAEIEEVVVTALGISREQKSLTYSTQQVGGEELTRAKSTNLINNINGKVAGISISASSSGIGGSAKVILRGNKSATGSNQVLYVVDGIPLNSTATTGQPSGYFGGERDGGDPIALINPEDIESMSVLKGPSAAALYGSQAANGVILITTKSGKDGRTSIDFSSSLQFDDPMILPEFQNTYGQGSNGQSNTTDYFSWGEKLETPGTNNINSFYNTGTNFNNSISLSHGTEQAQTYLSYANTAANGLFPENTLDRHNINLKQRNNFLDNRLTVDAGINYIQQNLDNVPLTGFYYNPIVGLYLLPPDQDLESYKTFEIFDPTTGRYEQNWYTLGDNETTQQNPWWIQNRNTTTSKRDRVLLNGSVKYKVNDWLNLQARGSMDRSHELYEREVYAGTQSILSGENGGYQQSEITVTQKYADFIASFSTPIYDKLNFNGLIGTSITDWDTEGTSYAPGGDGLTIANIFVMQNTTAGISTTSDDDRRQLQSVFASANFDYDGWLYLDLTARNDWSSTLAFTDTPSFFYPSVGLSANIHEKLHLPGFIDFMKVRGSYAQVGSPLPAYASNILNTVGNYGNISIATIATLASLEPEKTTSIEAGTEIKMFDRLGIDFTYYKTNTRNQYFTIAASEASFFSSYAINAGDIQNEGIELLLNYDVIKKEHFSWNSALNYSMNKNTIIELSDQIEQFNLSDGSRTNFISRFEVGGSFGDIYGIDFSRDESGRIIVNDGIPLRNSDYEKLGNSNPRWQMGWSNTLRYKNFGLYFLIDGKFDYQVYSITESMLDSYGVSARTADARDVGAVYVDAVDLDGNPVTSVDPQTWYTSVGGIGPVTSNYIYNGSAIRLRELALSYNFKLDSKVVKGLKLTATGRNLFFFYNEAPFDPESTMSTGNSLSGIDMFMMPSTRSYGLSLNLNF